MLVIATARLIPKTFLLLLQIATGSNYHRVDRDYFWGSSSGGLDQLRVIDALRVELQIFLELGDALPPIR